MFNVLVIAITCIICTWILSKANIKISIRKAYKDETPPPPVVQTQTITQDELDKLLKDTAPVTYDEVVKAVQSAIGGVLKDE